MVLLNMFGCEYLQLGNQAGLRVASPDIRGSLALAFYDSGIYTVLCSVQFFTQDTRDCPPACLLVACYPLFTACNRLINNLTANVGKSRADSNATRSTERKRDKQ